MSLFLRRLREANFKKMATYVKACKKETKLPSFTMYTVSSLYLCVFVH